MQSVTRAGKKCDKSQARENIRHCTYPSVVMVTKAHHIPSTGPLMGEAGNSFALKRKSCQIKMNNFEYLY